jgi:beta-glucosidase
MFNFTRYDGKRIVEPGEFELQIGASSADIREA